MLHTLFLFGKVQFIPCACVYMCVYVCICVRSCCYNNCRYIKSNTETCQKDKMFASLHVWEEDKRKPFCLGTQVPRQCWRSRYVSRRYVCVGIVHNVHAQEMEAENSITLTIYSV